jgi:predicted nuclease of predicted toxin-antitoxin system
LKLAILLDENISPAIADFLRGKRPDWDIRHVYDLELVGATDAVLFRQAQQLRAVVITFDEDFADTRMYPAGTHAGVIRLRLWPTTNEELESALDRLLESTADESISGSLIVIDQKRIRIRRSASHGE